MNVCSITLERWMRLDREHDIQITGSASAWRIRPGQDISARMHPKADGMILVFAGHGEFQVFDSAEPDPAGAYVPSAHYPLDAPPPGATNSTPTLVMKKTSANVPMNSAT